MIHRAIGIGEWVFDFLFAPSGNDLEGVLSCLKEYKAPEWILERTREIMTSGEMDCGFTFPNPDIRRGVVWVGPQSSGEEWINTTVHEIVHAAMSISPDLGIGCPGEPFAYLVGDITGEVADILCALGCDECRRNLLEETEK